LSFQNEQISACDDCIRRSAMSGKDDQSGRLRDQLTGALIGLARVIAGNGGEAGERTRRLIAEALYGTSANAGISDEAISRLLLEVAGEKRRQAPQCSSCAHPCGRNDDYDMSLLWNAEADIRGLKALILFGIREMAACVHKTGARGCGDGEVEDFILRVLDMLGNEWDVESLLYIVVRMAEMNLRCVKLLDRVSGEIMFAENSQKLKRRPFIVICGHGRRELGALLELIAGKGVSIIDCNEISSEEMRSSQLV